MSLKINFDWKKCIKWVVVGILAVFLLVFFIRTVTWEDDYYRRMEGSERSAQVNNAPEEELDETAIAEDDINNYSVPDSHPKFIEIEKIGVKKTRILPVSVKANKELDTPANIFDVGWYEASGKPGEGKTAVLDGHNGGPTKYGVFKKLPELVNGDIITITRGDDQVFRYEVVENSMTASIEDSNDYMKTKALYSPESGKESITLITCTGSWNSDKRTYDSRQFVRAVLVEE